MKTKVLLTAILAIFFIGTDAQKKFSLSGWVTDNTNKEKLSNASVWLNPFGGDSLLQWTTVTDAKGHFNFDNLNYGEYTLHISYTGFLPSANKILLTKDDKVDIGLLKANTSLANVSIFSEKKN